MPWEDKTVEEKREEFAKAAAESNNFSALCREYGITRRTGYKWLGRYQSGQPMADQSRRPLNSPNKTPPDVEELVLALRRENPGWGARTIHCVLERQGHQNLPCEKTINNILQRHDCISKEESQKRQPFIRYQKKHSNDMWQTDFKGEFPMLDRKRCYPLTILDDCTRLCIAIKPSLGTANVVIPAFQEAFYKYGLPKSVLSDHGGQFAGFNKGYTHFEKWLMDLDILPIHGRVKHPQTQGKIERFHRTMKEELLKHQPIADIEDAQTKFDLWRHKYNHLRPHQALNMKCPAEVYVPSQRKFPDHIPKVEYGGNYHVIKVNSWGYVRFDRWQVYLSETFIDEYIEFRPAGNGETFIACYRNFKIASFDCTTGELINRSIARL